MTEKITRTVLGIVAYGETCDYHFGAKFQVLKLLKAPYYNPDLLPIWVATDRPNLFADYPVKTVEISEQNFYDWSLQGRQHFGVKIKALEKLSETSQEEKLVLLDTDMFWKKSPLELARRINETTAIMYKDEGYIYHSKNRSIQNFELTLHDVAIPYSEKIFQLSEQSKMYGSAMLGLHRSHFKHLGEAFKLFQRIEPIVPAHTVEQFSIAETLRTNGINIRQGLEFVSQWSSIGKKAYVTPQLKKFFQMYGESDIEMQKKHLGQISTTRPIGMIVKQKWKKITNTRF